MSDINWSKVSGQQFEKFVFHLLGKYGFKNRIWYGKGGSDKGRDIVAKTVEKLPLGIEFQRKWIVQCKRWSEFPPKNVLDEEISSAKEHNPDFWLLVTTAEPSSNIIDFLKSADERCGFKILFLAGSHIDELLMDNKNLKELLDFPEAKQKLEEAEGKILEPNDYTVYYVMDKGIKIKGDHREKIISSNWPSEPILSPDGNSIAYISPFMWELIGELYIYNFKNDNNELLIKKNDLKNDYTIKEVQWLSNKFLLVISGYAYGTASVGGGIYLVDNLHNEISIFKEDSKLEEYKNLRINKEDRKVKVTKIKYDKEKINYKEKDEEFDYDYMLKDAKDKFS